MTHLPGAPTHAEHAIPPPPWREGPAALANQGAAATTAAVVAAARPSLAALLTGHILRDGELVLLILRPSLWWVVLSSLKSIAAVLILVLAAHAFPERLPPHNPWIYTEGGLFLIAGRLMWAVLQWAGRLYVLTDLRIVRLAGVFSIDVFDCPLRKVARTQPVASVKERLFRLGSIDIFPREDHGPPASWQSVARPAEIHEQILAALQRSRSNGGY